MAVAQTLDVVRGLVHQMKVVMEGALYFLVWVRAWYETNLVDGKASTDGIRQSLGGSGWCARMSITFDLVL